MPLLLDPDDIPAVGFGAYRALKVSRRTFTRPQKPREAKTSTTVSSSPVPGK